MYFQLIKAITTLAYLSLLWLTWLFIDGGLSLQLAIGCYVISTLWLLLTYLHMQRLLKTYFDILSRLEVIIPLWIGIALSLIAEFAAHHIIGHLLAAAELTGWLWIYILYRRNRARYIIQGHGPLPYGTWINPPSAALHAGDLILTSGRVATNLRESVGHAELVIEMPAGNMMAFSSYMAKGTVLNQLNDITNSTKENGHYLVLTLQHKLSKRQCNAAASIAQAMVDENRRWQEQVNQKRRHLIKKLPIPKTLRNILEHRWVETGYDWMGLFFGRLAHHRWTCIGACLELYRRLGIKTNPYGTGLFGLGTGLLDPIMPVRFLSDPAFRLLTIEDKEKFEL